MKHPGRKVVYAILLLCLNCVLTAPSSAALPFSSPYGLSFVIQPSDVISGSSLFATTVLTHPIKNLIRSNAVQFQVFDRHGRPVPGTSILPITTDSRGLAVFVDAVLQPGKGYTLVASCGRTVIRSRPFDVLTADPIYPLASAPARQECDPATSACPVVLPPVAVSTKTTAAKVTALPKVVASKPVVIPNPTPGTAREVFFPVPLAACPEPLEPAPMPAPLPNRAGVEYVAPTCVLPTSFDLVVIALPVVPQELEVEAAVPDLFLKTPAVRYPY